MAAAVCVVGGLPLVMANRPSWYCTMSATAWVSAALPDRQHHIVSCTRVSLSVTRFAMYAPVVVRESAPLHRRLSARANGVGEPRVGQTENNTILESYRHAAVAIRRSLGYCISSRESGLHRGTEAEEVTVSISQVQHIKSADTGI